MERRRESRESKEFSRPFGGFLFLPVVGVMGSWNCVSVFIFCLFSFVNFYSSFLFSFLPEKEKKRKEGKVEKLFFRKAFSSQIGLLDFLFRSIFSKLIVCFNLYFKTSNSKFSFSKSIYSFDFSLSRKL